MNDTTTIDLPTMMAFQREQTDNTLKTIIERLHVKDMGPADYIRTKHEVKAFLASGDPAAAEAVLHRAHERVDFWQREGMRLSIERGRRMEW